MQSAFRDSAVVDDHRVTGAPLAEPSQASLEWQSLQREFGDAPAASAAVPVPFQGQRASTPVGQSWHAGYVGENKYAEPSSHNPHPPPPSFLLPAAATPDRESPPPAIEGPAGSHSGFDLPAYGQPSQVESSQAV